MTRRFADILRSFGLKWSVTSPTRVTADSATAIDNVVRNMTDIDVLVVDTAISDHYGQQVIVNAFDCVDHQTLTHKLEYYGIRGRSLKWLESYLSNRTQFVGISGVRSEELGLNYGVPQGSILSPFLFLIYVNDVGSSVQQGRLVQYADDTTLYLNSESQEKSALDSAVGSAEIDYMVFKFRK
ncbi:uncharacterized protein LOC124369627 [Homalodisca vitripennis]|uniref:uncharacterized protein LOC124369627 n=1 Tax=Homalodisca vitripennis TaxID=197043 RepID=UPI001EECB707|nr:uncharacterized protein LOC124369627 [Homalodisca vitripennis]